MAEDQVKAEEQIRTLKVQLMAQDVSFNDRRAQEMYITYELLKDHPLVMQQRAWVLPCNLMDRLYNFVCGIHSYIIDDEVFEQWISDGFKQTYRYF